MKQDRQPNMEDGAPEKPVKRQFSRRQVLAGAAIAGAAVAVLTSPEASSPAEAASAPIIDTHFHIVTTTLMDLVAASPDKYGVRLNPENDQGQTITWLDRWGGTFPVKGGNSQFYWPAVTMPARDAWGSMAEAKSYLQKTGADGAVASSHIGWHRYTMPDEQKLNLFRANNDELAKWVKGESMFKAMAALPLPDGQQAADELRRTSRDLGMKGGMIQTNIQAEPWNLDDKRLEPLWKAAQDLDVPIYLHPSGGANPNAPADRLNGWGLSFLGNAIETTIAASYLVASGVMDRYPKLKVVLSHGGGYFGMAYGRLSHYWYVQPTTTGNSKMEGSAYLKRFYYDTILHRPESLAYLIGLVGADHVMYGTDHPFTNQPPDPVAQIRGLQISAADKDTVLGSAAKMYGFA